MAYDARLAEQVRNLLATRPGTSEKAMFGGLCFLLHGNMCCGIIQDKLMLRIDPKTYEDMLNEKHTAPMDFTGRIPRNMIYLLPEGWKNPRQMAKWIDRSLAFIQTIPPKKKKIKLESAKNAMKQRHLLQAGKARMRKH
jgi:TfoX/Sxy family transcriptional regulator of competence genes